MTERPNFPSPSNLIGTAILDIHHEKIMGLATILSRSDQSGLEFLRTAHLHLVQALRPVYSVNEQQQASLTLQKRRGSCSQRTAVLEAIARAGGVPNRVHAFAVEGRFWYPRFRFTKPFIPDSVLLVWPQFYVGDRWLDFDELHAPIDQMAADAKGGFTNAGESIFEAVKNTPIDFMGKTCGLACSRPEHDLSRFLVENYGLFDTRDEAFEQFGSFQHTLRGRAFELVFGDRKSS
jgi:Transglutaminase-like superfamily